MPVSVSARRRSRLSTPPVNQNPQPPNAPNKPQRNPAVRRQPGPGPAPPVPGPGNDPLPVPDNQPGQGGGDGKPKLSPAERFMKRLGRWQAGQINQITQPVSPTAPQGTTTEFTRENVEKQVQAFDGTPASALAFSSYTPSEGQPDPRDSTYWKNVNNLLFNTQGQYNNLQLQQTRAEMDYGKGKQDMQIGRQREQRALAEEAMRSGLSRSGWLDTADAEQTYDFLRAEEDYGTRHFRDTADRRGAMSQVIQDFIAGERDLVDDALTAYSSNSVQEAAQAAPVYTPKDLRTLERILKGGKIYPNRNNRQPGGSNQPKGPRGKRPR